MAIQYSAEIRWIVAGKAPASIKRWYEGDAFCNREKVRVDYYVKFPGDAFVGIKLRKYADGRQNLEFKPIKKSNVALELPSGISGRVEEWEKWSTEAEAAQEFSNLLNRKCLARSPQGSLVKKILSGWRYHQESQCNEKRDETP